MLYVKLPPYRRFGSLIIIYIGSITRIVDPTGESIILQEFISPGLDVSIYEEYIYIYIYSVL